MATLDVNRCSRPILRDLDEALLQSLLEEERKLWLQRSSGITNGLGGQREETDFPSENVAAVLVRHGKQLKDIHSFFQTLIPRRYLMKLQGQMVQDFQVINNIGSIPYTGTQGVKISYKESDIPLHPQEKKIYDCVLLAALYPVLSSSEDSSLSLKQTDEDASSSSYKDERHSQSNDNEREPRLTPNSKECMLYDKDPIASTSTFPIDSDNLIDLVRKAFHLTQRIHSMYQTNLERQINNDPAKMLLEEMRGVRSVLKNDCHPFFHANSFHKRDGYANWLETEIPAIEKIIKEQEQLVKSPVDHSTPTIPINFKDKHDWYRALLAKLYRLESTNYWLNIGTNEAIPKKPLSPESSRLLNEFGERYRIGELYRRISLLEYLARNFEPKRWYCRHVISVIESILQSLKTEGCLITREEIKMFKKAMHDLHALVKNSLTNITRLFPKNSPDGALQAVIAVLTILVDVDQNEIFGEHNGETLVYYLKNYVKEEMDINYERQKIINSAQLNIDGFGQQSTPILINLTIFSISEKLRNYRMFYKRDFIEYFDIVEIAVEVFYGHLMNDVHELCNTYPVNQQMDGIDYPMIALAYRLSSFDREPAWENYLSLEVQTWREPFLKHSLSWLSSLKNTFQDFVLKALQQDTWQAVTTNDSDAESTERFSERGRGTQPRDIATPHSSASTSGRATTGRPTPSITASANSAFVQVSSRSGSAARNTPRVPERTDGDPADGTSIRPSNDGISSTGHAIDAKDGSTSKQFVKKQEHSAGKSGVSSYSSCAGRKSLLRYVREPSGTNSQTFHSAACSIDSQSSVSSSAYTDAKSDASDFQDYWSCDGDDVADGRAVIGHHGDSCIPVSSSSIALICGTNRLISMVCHISQLLCPRQMTIFHDSSRLSTEDRKEVQERLESGRAKMARELSVMLESSAILYGYYVISAESCGMTEDELGSVIGDQCLTKIRHHISLLRENNIRSCRHNTAGVERCNTADSTGSCVSTCLSLCRIKNSPTRCELVVEEMCVRVNSVKAIENVLATLIEIAAQTVMEPSLRGDIENEIGSDVAGTSSPKSRQTGESPSSASVRSLGGSKIVDRQSLTKTIDELKEIEEGLFQIMAYRANAVISKLLELLLTLNLGSFDTRKRLQPVLNATKRTIHTLASNLYRDCFAKVLHHFWLAVVKNFENEMKNLVSLNGTAADQANLLLEAVSYFTEIFRAEDVVPLSFISNSIEPVLQSLNLYILPTSILTEMHSGLQTRIDNDRENRTINTAHQYQRAPSEALIRDIRIELHSERAHFSGQRCVDCVADQIRSKGNVPLGICAVPSGEDEESAVELGQYLLDNGVIRFFGKTMRKIAEDSDVDDDLDEELQKYNRPGSTLIIPGKKTPSMIVNDKIKQYEDSLGSGHGSRNSSLDTVFGSGHASGNSSLNIIFDDTAQSTRFMNSENFLYKFESSDIEESFDYFRERYQTIERGNARQENIIRVLFTRRNIDRDAKEFLAVLGQNHVLQELLDEYTASHHCF